MKESTSGTSALYDGGILGRVILVRSKESHRGFRNLN